MIATIKTSGRVICELCQKQVKEEDARPWMVYIGGGQIRKSYTCCDCQRLILESCLGPRPEPLKELPRQPWRTPALLFMAAVTLAAAAFARTPVEPLLSFLWCMWKLLIAQLLFTWGLEESTIAVGIYYKRKKEASGGGRAGRG